jgi:predicted acetyltransferase
MRAIKRIPPDDYEAFARIIANAYPSLDLHRPESLRQFAQERMVKGAADPLTSYVGLYTDGQLLGGMRLFDFTMNVFGTELPAGGVGLVAVDLAHKKQHVARDLIADYLRHYRGRGTTLATLYPFRLDFYTQMGFGYGAKLHQYRIKPANVPASGRREQVRLLDAGDKQLLADCYRRYTARTHGMIHKRPAEVDAIFEQPQQRVVAYVEDGVVRGYFLFQFVMESVFINYDIEIREFIYETREAFLGLLAFLNSQADQVRSIIFNTSDDSFHHLFDDPRTGTGNLLPHVYHESHTSGVGLMYRVLDTAGLFHALADHDFGGQTCRLKLTITDTFLPENAGSLVVAFEDGRPRLADAAFDAEVTIDVSEFSSLVLGVTPFRALYRYGLAEISDPAWVAVVNRLFLADEPPICCTRF